MKNTELRIGNLIEVIHIDYGRTQTSVDIDILSNMDDLDEKITYHPIPITHEWLEKFNFFRDSVSGYYHPIWRKFYPLYVRGKFYNFNGLGLSVIDMEYIHQLQNRFFDLTGEELTCDGF